MRTNEEKRAVGYLCRPKLDAPADITINRWGFETHWLPVRGIKVLGEATDKANGWRKVKLTSKWSVSLLSSRCSFSSNKITASRMNRCAMCWARLESMPDRKSSVHSSERDDSEMEQPYRSRSACWTLLYLGRLQCRCRRHCRARCNSRHLSNEISESGIVHSSVAKHKKIADNGLKDAIHGISTVRWLSIVDENKVSNVLFTSNPRSSAVRSSDMAHKTFHRQSISAKYPRQIGDAALMANWKKQRFNDVNRRTSRCRLTMMPVIGVSWS